MLLDDQTIITDETVEEVVTLSLSDLNSKSEPSMLNIFYYILFIYYLLFIYYYNLASSTSAVAEPPSSDIDCLPSSSQSATTVEEHLTSNMYVS